MKIKPEDITNVIGSPVANTRKYWPLIVAELERLGKNKLSFQVAILATIGVESGNFEPINELGGKAYFTKLYDVCGEKPARARRMGNTSPGDGARYHGRGFIQLTWKHNYDVYGKALGVDLVNHPEKANEPEIAVKVLVKYMLDHGVDVWADRAFRTDDEYPEEFCTRKIRQLVNGGYRHYDKFKRHWDKFKVIALRG